MLQKSATTGADATRRRQSPPFGGRRRLGTWRNIDRARIGFAIWRIQLDWSRAGFSVGQCL